MSMLVQFFSEDCRNTTLKNSGMNILKICLLLILCLFSKCALLKVNEFYSYDYKEEIAIHDICYCCFKKPLKSVRVYQITKKFDYAVNIKLSGEK